MLRPDLKGEPLKSAHLNSRIINFGDSFFIFGPSFDMETCRKAPTIGLAQVSSKISFLYGTCSIVSAVSIDIHDYVGVAHRNSNYRKSNSKK